MTSQQGPSTRLSAVELLNLRESSWRSHLRRVSLVAELPVKPQHGAQALVALGRVLKKVQDEPTRRKLLWRWPAVQVISTVSVATQDSKGGSVWPPIQDRAQSTEQSFQKLWGDAFLRNLGLLGLPDFSDINETILRYAGPILMHSGIPDYSLRDFFRLITRHRESHYGASPESFVAWAAEQAVAKRLYDIDKPVERFLRYGGDFAVDVADRTFELLDLAGSGRSTETVLLPDRFKRAAESYAREEPYQRSSYQPAGGRSAAAQPRLMLDPYGRGPFVRLPAVDTSGGDQATWRITADEREDSVFAQSLWPGEPAPETDYPLTTPVRAVMSALLGHERLAHSLPVVDDKDPLLVFGEDGEQRSTGMPLRGSLLWVLFHGALEDLEVTGQHSLETQGILPPGWQGWTLALLDVSQASAIRLKSSDRTHRVRSIATARIVFEQPVPGLFSRNGAPVFATPPAIQVPPIVGAENAWSVTVTLDDGSTPLNRVELPPDAGTSWVWEQVAGPLLGRIHVQVRGPWGRGASAEFHIAEGVSVVSDPPWRRADGNGLVPATAKLAGPASMHFESTALVFDSSRTALPVTVQAGSSMLLIVRPPHMSMSYQSVAMSTAPAIRPVKIPTEELRDNAGILTVDLQSDGEPRLHAITGDHVVQVIEPSGPVRAGRYQFDLRRLSETVLQHPHLRLALDAGGTTCVATVTPGKLFSFIERTSNALLIHDCPDLSNLTALVYLAHAPWRPAPSLPVQMGAVLLPSGMAQAGPLSVHLRVDDPWLPEPVPPTPPRQSVLVSGEGWFESEDDEDETALSRFIAGQGHFPRGSIDLAWLWAILDQLPDLPLYPRHREVAIACDEELLRHPVPALLALNSTSVRAERVPELVIRSGLASQATNLPPRARVEWTNANVIPAALLTAHRRVEAHLAGNHEANDEARLVCGDILADLLNGSDPAKSLGKLDRAAGSYLYLDPGTRQEFRRQVNLLPKGLLDGDSRASAAFQLLDNLDATPSWLRKDAGKALVSLRLLLERLGEDVGLALVTARQHPEQRTGWAAFSPLSIGWAWVARLAARGNTQAATWLSGQQRIWKHFARYAPDLVTIDLVRAEFLLAARDSTLAQKLEQA